jgi:hypothetical protein
MCVSGHVYVYEWSCVCVWAVICMCVSGHVYVCERSCVCVWAVMCMCMRYRFCHCFYNFSNEIWNRFHSVVFFTYYCTNSNYYYIAQYIYKGVYRYHFVIQKVTRYVINRLNYFISIYFVYILYVINLTNSKVVWF